MDRYGVVGMNFDEGYDYMVGGKEDFMGYGEMKRLKWELIKMNGSYLIRKEGEEK